MNNSTNNNDNSGFDAGGLTYGVAFVMGLFFLLLTVAFACVRLCMARGPPSHHAGVEQGLGLGLQEIDTSFERYPKLLYSQVKKGSSSSSISSICSICLGDYKESDLLRLLPQCEHLFHLACVDPWLRLHSTCPICRKSSLQPSHTPLRLV